MGMAADPAHGGPWPAADGDELRERHGRARPVLRCRTRSCCRRVRSRGAGAAWQRGDQGALPAQADKRGMVGDDEPDRAAGGLGRGGGSPPGRSLRATAPYRDHTGRKIYHLLGRQRHERECRAPGCWSRFCRTRRGGPRGSRCFLVPKLIPDDAGQPGLANAVKVVSLEHKMGLTVALDLRAAYTRARPAVLSGERTAANGRRCSTMMNNARLWPVAVAWRLDSPMRPTQAAVAIWPPTQAGPVVLIKGGTGTILGSCPDVRRMPIGD